MVWYFQALWGSLNGVKYNNTHNYIVLPLVFGYWFYRSISWL